jgi:uncharacterized protein
LLVIQSGAFLSTLLGTTRGGRLSAVVVFFYASALFGAETIPPKPARMFNDYAGVVSPGVAERLNTQLAQFERDTSNQVVVAVYRKMESDSSIEDFTQRTFQAWQIGQKDRRNGVLFVVFIDDRRMRIQPGYGLEGALPDITCNEIIRDAVAPRFRTKDYEGGLATGIDLIEKAIRGEYKGTGRTNNERRGNTGGGTAGLLVFLFFILMLMIAVRASRRRGGYRYTGWGGPFVMGNWGGGSGGWSSGGSSGGGFGGFSGGGGSSGGGGASGSW